MKQRVTKRIYLVRHGESVGNAARVSQSPEMELTEIGLGQAKMLAHRFKSLKVDAIVSSDYKRTLQTAEAISKVVGKKVEKEPLLREIRRTEEVIGKSYLDPEVKKILDESEKHKYEADWHYGTEENLHDLMKRANKCWEMLVARPEREIVVVTHGLYLGTLMSVLTFGEELTARILDLSLRRRVMYNTGITLCEAWEGKWRMVSWNDHAHLG